MRGHAKPRCAWTDAQRLTNPGRQPRLSRPLQHEDARNLTVVFPRDSPHDVALGAGGWGKVCSECGGFQGRLEEGQHIENEFLSEDAWLQRQPRVTWNNDWGRCCLLMLDPDAPKPASEEIGGHRCGALGPWLHWLVADAVGAPEQVSTETASARPRGRTRRGWS